MHKFFRWNRISGLFKYYKILSVILVAVIIATLLWSFTNTKDQNALIAEKSDSLINYVQVDVTVTELELLKGELEVHLELFPHGIYSLSQTPYPSQNIILTTNNMYSNKPDILFKEDEFMDKGGLRFETREGNLNYYPFDSHTSEVSISLETEEEAIPISALIFSHSHIPGYRLSTNIERSRKHQTLTFKIRRSWSIILLSLLIVIIMWALALIALFLALKVRKADKVPEANLMSLMPTLLFAFPAIRNIQPSIPPFGTVSDFLSFFWTETIVVIAFILIAKAWLERWADNTLLEQEK